MSVVQHAPYNILKSHAFSLPTCPTRLTGGEKQQKKGRKIFFCGLENKKKNKKKRDLFLGMGELNFFKFFREFFFKNFPQKHLGTTALPVFFISTFFLLLIGHHRPPSNSSSTFFYIN